MSPHSKSQATVFAILAVFCLAAQHPLSKPLAQQADSFVLARIGALIALLGVPLIFVLARGGRDWLALLSNRSALPGVVVLSGLGITSFFLYSAGLKGTHPVVVALFLNTSVLWAALWTRLLSGRSLPKAFVSTVLLAMGVIVFAASGGAMNDLFQLRLAPSNLLLLVVPALYTLKSVLATRWFGQSHPMEVSATLAVGSVFLLSPTLISRVFVRECGELWEHVSAGDLVAFGLGTLSGAVLGGAFYIMALARSEGQYAY
ncbi:MAG TPA: EamA family transporter, partial [Planctomycetota bacterium]|nr:EamA family transporter [Planctomycetota bacterium]